MSRVALYKILVACVALIGFALLWSLAYEIVVAARWNPALPSEGSSRFALLRAQNTARNFSAVTMAFDHFYARLLFPHTRAETIFRGLIAAAGVLGLGGAAFTARYVMRPQKPYGDARFGTLAEAGQKGLIAKKGLLLGRLNGKLLISDDPAHILVVGPTRSGKGVSFVIPNGFFWRGSSVWFDPKRENFAAFAAYRKSLGDTVFMFSPGERDTHRYNPLDFIRRDETMPTDCAVVASFIVPEGTGSSEIWSRSARQLLSAMIGYVLSAKQFDGRRHMRAVTLLTSTGHNFRGVLREIVERESSVLPSWIVQGFNQFIALEPETRNSALFNVTAALNAWNSDLVAAATATSDFDIRDLRRTPMALFIGCTVAQLDVFRPIIKILVQQVHDLLMASMPGKDEPHQVLVMIDEFRQLGRMDSLVSKLTINLGYGLRFVLVLQDLGQLDEVYGKPVRVTTVAACQVRLFVRINDIETSKYVSEMLGSTTTEIRTPIIRASQGLFGRRDKSVSFHERPFRTPEELRNMAQDRAILLVPNSPGFELQKVFYFRDKPFRDAARVFATAKVKLPILERWRDWVPPPAPASIALAPADHAALADAPASETKPQNGNNQPPEQKPAPESTQSRGSIDESAPLIPISDSPSAAPPPPPGAPLKKRSRDALSDASPIDNSIDRARTLPLASVIAVVEESKNADANAIRGLKPRRPRVSAIAERITVFGNDLAEPKRKF